MNAAISIYSRRSYQDAIDWIAHNDDPDETDVETVRGTLTVGLVADLFGTSTSVVANDVVLARMLSCESEVQS